MNSKVYVMGAVLIGLISLFSADQARASCRANMVGEENIIIKTFTEQTCSEVSKRCNRNLRFLRRKYPGSYRDAYCDVVNTSWPTHRSMTPRHSTPRSRHTPRPVAYITRAYDRCQSHRIVRCTQEWSNGRVITEDHACRGCRGYNNPHRDPCGWVCSFPPK